MIHLTVNEINRGTASDLMCSSYFRWERRYNSGFYTFHSMFLIFLAEEQDRKRLRNCSELNICLKYMFKFIYFSYKNRPFNVNERCLPKFNLQTASFLEHFQLSVCNVKFNKINAYKYTISICYNQ